MLNMTYLKKKLSTLWIIEIKLKIMYHQIFGINNNNCSK